MPSMPCCNCPDGKSNNCSGCNIYEQYSNTTKTAHTIGDKIRASDDDTIALILVKCLSVERKTQIDRLVPHLKADTRMALVDIPFVEAKMFANMLKMEI